MGRNQLDEIAALLPNFPDYNLLILGYTDNVGNDIFNQLLSEKRAKTCFDYLVNKGVNPNRMTTTGFGEMNPIATNDTAEGRAENRRVMVTFEK